MAVAEQCRCGETLAPRLEHVSLELARLAQLVRMTVGETFQYPSVGVALNASGAGTSSPDDMIVPRDRRFLLTRLLVEDVTGTYTPAAPYSSATAWAGIYANGATRGQLRDFAPISPAGPMIPGVWIDSPGSGIPFGPLEKIVLAVTAGPANGQLLVTATGRLVDAV